MARLPRWYVSVIVTHFFSRLSGVASYQYAVKVLRTPNDPQSQKRIEEASVPSFRVTINIDRWQLAAEYQSSRSWMTFLPRVFEISAEFVETDGGRTLAIVHPWFEYKILDFLVNFPHVNKLQVVGLIFLFRSHHLFTATQHTF
jgi:hypothetical protein